MPDGNDDHVESIRADVVSRLEHDKRLRAVETEQAAMAKSLEMVHENLPKMEERLMAAIAAAKPASPWPAVGALAAVMAVLLAVAGFASGAI